MILVQSSCAASCGDADSLIADNATLTRYVGRSSLDCLDTIFLHYTRGTRWALNASKTDATPVPTMPLISLNYAQSAR